MAKEVFSLCGMCAVRCPVKVEVEDGVVKWIEGNPHDPGMAGRLCAKGSAGTAMLYDYERPQTPLIREGKRGEGKWRKASWDEAFDYITDKLKPIVDEYGGKAVALSDRGGPFRDIHRSFIRALGSPYYLNHDATCARNVQHAALSLFGSGRKTFNYNYKNCKHLVLYGRNVFESLKVSGANAVMEMLDAGGKITYIDIRASNTAMKAARFWQINPGTDYALNLALIHTIIRDNLYDAAFVEKWVDGLQELKTFVADYTPAWAEKETGIPADEIVAFAHEVAAQAPAVIFHPGWMVARYSDSFYAVRSIYILNALLGCFETKGGLFFQKGPGDAGAKGLNAILGGLPKPEAKRVDGCGWKHKHFDAGPGLMQLFYQALLSEDPYPVKAYFVFRHDPLLSMPDPEEQKKALDKLDLLVVLDANYSETGWYADVLLPSATYLEKGSPIATGKGLKPHFRIRKPAVEIRNDAKPDWWVFKSLADRMGVGEHLPFEDMDNYWEFQLKGTGYSVSDFEETGFVRLADKPIWWDRMNDLKFKTPSGKIELVSSRLAESGFESFKPYESPQVPEEGMYRLVFGRSPVHTHGQTMNNPILHEIMPENCLWINSTEAQKLGVVTGDKVEVTSADGTHSGQITANVTDFIHPESVFMVHGFGRKIPWQTRGYNKGLGDYRFETGMLDKYDPVGGGISLLECVVKVTKAA